MKYMQLTPGPARTRRLLVPISISAVLVLFIALAGNARAILDYVRLYGYQPESQVVSLADQTTMTPSARRLFYVNRPQIDGRQAFNTECSNSGEQTIVLGCYHPVDRGIFLFGVTDTRLNGVEQVTAAHEMLHAAYDRLSRKERQDINQNLQAYYDANVQDSRIRSTVAAYQQSEPKDVLNEMHSIFATEIENLPSELESYYAKYFSNRKAVVKFAATYQQEFTSRQDQVAGYDKQLGALKKEIDAATATLRTRETEINAMQRQMEAARASGNYDAYNESVPGFNAKVDQYNALIRATQNNIASYNRLVAIRNSVAVEVRELTQSISSQLQPIAQ